MGLVCCYRSLVGPPSSTYIIQGWQDGIDDAVEVVSAETLKHTQHQKVTTPSKFIVTLTEQTLRGMAATLSTSLPTRYPSRARGGQFMLQIVQGLDPYLPAQVANLSSLFGCCRPWNPPRAPALSPAGGPGPDLMTIPTIPPDSRRIDSHVAARSTVRVAHLCGWGVLFSLGMA